MNRRVEISQNIVKIIEQFPKVHKFLTGGDTGCHPQHLVDTIADELAARENILVGIAAELKAMLTEAQEEIERLKTNKDDCITSLEWALEHSGFECNCEPYYEWDTNATIHADGCSVYMSDHLEITLENLKSQSRTP